MWFRVFRWNVSRSRLSNLAACSKWKFVIRGDDGGEVVIRHARKPFLHSHTHPHSHVRESLVLFSARRSSWLSHLSAFILYFSPERPHYLNRYWTVLQFSRGPGINSSDWIFCFILIKRNKIPAVGYSAAIAGGSFRDGIIICSVIIGPLNMLIESVIQLGNSHDNATPK